MALELELPDLVAYLDEIFPQVRGEFTYEALEENAVRIRLNVQPHHLRPGNTISGPSMFSLADVAVYAMVLGRLGRVPMAVTTNCAMDFMRKPQAGRDLIAEGRLLKLGRLLAVGDVHIRSDGSDDLVARATMTYAIPPR